MKNIKELAGELEKEIGAEKGITVDAATESVTSPSDRTISWKFPSTEANDVVMAMVAFRSNTEEDNYVISLITSEGTKSYFMNGNSSKKWIKEIEDKVRGKHVYTTGYDLNIFSEVISPIPPGDKTVIEELSTRNISGLAKSMLFIRPTPHGNQRIAAQKYLDHLFSIYFIYLRLKHGTKDINLGKFKVPVKI